MMCAILILELINLMKYSNLSIVNITFNLEIDVINDLSRQQTISFEIDKSILFFKLTMEKLYSRNDKSILRLTYLASYYIMIRQRIDMFNTSSLFVQISKFLEFGKLKKKFFVQFSIFQIIPHILISYISFVSILRHSISNSSLRAIFLFDKKAGRNGRDKRKEIPRSERSTSSRTNKRKSVWYWYAANAGSGYG